MMFSKIISSLANRKLEISWHPLAVILLFLIPLLVNSQSKEFCGSDVYQKNLEKLDPNLKTRREYFDKKIKSLGASNIIQELKKNNSHKNNTIYDIPVVVHVIEASNTTTNSTLYRSDSQIIQWLDNANKMFATTYGNGFYSTGTGPDGGTVMPFRLILAKRTPSCLPTTGIIRYNAGGIANYDASGVRSSTTSPGASTEDIKNLAPHWPENSYFNIYLVTGFNGNFGNSGLMGYAGLPANSDSGYDSFMKVTTLTRSNDITLVHEFGHALGLLHTFGNNASDDNVTCPSDKDCTQDNDKVCDTQAAPSFLSVSTLPTNSTYNPCAKANYDGVQYNIMNYSNSPRKFTPGQHDRALAQIILLRPSLLTSKGAIAPDSSPESVISTSCNPTGVTNLGNWQIGPVHVKFGSINAKTEGGNHIEGGNDFYHDYTSVTCYNTSYSTELIPNSVYPIEVGVKYSAQSVRVWIDYNNNGTFETEELVINNLKATPADATGSIGYVKTDVTIPNNAVKNKALRMRVKADFGGVYNPCLLSYGQIEDYLVKIIDNNTAPVVYIPDQNFKRELLLMEEINTNGDNEIQVSEAEAFTDDIYLVELEISSLVGIEAFKNLTSLEIIDNNVTEVDLSQNTKLMYLDLDRNNISHIDLSKNLELRSFSINRNNLTSLDLSKNEKLSFISVRDNNISNLVLGNHIDLTDIVLKRNKLTKVDLSMYPNLFFVDLDSNLFTEVNIKNGNNSNIDVFSVTDNPDLRCILVDDPNNVPQDWEKDETATYTTNCSTLTVKDIANKEIKVYPNPVKSLLHISQESEVLIYNISGQLVGHYPKVINIDMSNFQNAMYLVIVKDKNGKESNRFKIVKN